MSWRWFIGVVVLMVLVTGLFWAKPQLDIEASSYFYANQTFQGLLNHWEFVVRHILNGLVWLTAILAVIGFLAACCWKGRPAWLTKRSCAFIVLSFALAPGLVVNTVLKNNWGRPRPIQVTQFGGSAQYQKPWVMSSQCDTNCSFVCGDCAAAFAFFAFFLLARRYKKTILTAVILWSVLLGGIRLSQGGHFISDILLAYGVDFVVIFLLYKAMGFDRIKRQLQHQC